MGLIELATQMVTIPMPAEIVTWTPSSEIVNVCRAIAGIALLAWAAFAIFKFLFPGRGSRNAFRQMGLMGVIGAGGAILILADVRMLPEIVNWVYTYILLPAGELFTGFFS